MKGIITNVILSGAGLSFIMLLLSRLIPNKALKKSAVKTGRVLSTLGRTKFGKKFWEGLENYIENSLGVLFIVLKEGWNEDDNK